MVIRVKCPYTYRNFTIEEMLQMELKGKETKKSFFLKADSTVNENHPYWLQIQGEIYATNVSWCNFVVWTLKEMKIIRISADNNWPLTNIPKLVEFKINELLPTSYTQENND